jgi:hypothetical protein
LRRHRSDTGLTMKRLLTSIAMWLALFYLLIFIPPTISQAKLYASQAQGVDIYGEYKASIYANTPQFAVYGVNRLDTYANQIFILGGSEAGQAFIPAKVAKEVPGYKVHNLCVAASNVTEMQEMVDIIESHIDLHNIKRPVFVLTSHFVYFLDNRRAFNGDLTHFDEERLRHHLYYLSSGHVLPALPEPLMGPALFLVRPFIWLYTLKFNINDRLGGMRNLEHNEGTSQHDWSFYKQFRLRQFENRGYTDDQFDAFANLIKRLKALNATIVVVDLPVQSFYREKFPIYAEYRKRLREVVDDPAVHYLDLSAWESDSKFRDDTHVRAEFWDRWSARLAAFLKTSMGT